MYFKRLEIVGFKSFMNKTKLKFEPGVTAVVGPNGCGKSNIVDAIKWVLGEQSVKSMRSSAMMDVIFNGTEKHAPVNMAEVSLTLSNEDRSLPVDYDEVTITRRLFRSGESEYLLNKTLVRLQDIRNVLLGTGIGTSLYSIVEQGRMDMVISSKPEERRYIFEEASGITKFKVQKREAMFKLERTQENILRINDIIREIERQINSIERQARKAERYKARFEELKDLDVKLSYKRYSELGSDDSVLVGEQEALRSSIAELTSSLEEASEGLEALREEFGAIMEEIQVSQGDVMRLSSEIDKSNHVIEMNRERIQELQKYVERLDWEIEEATGRRDTMNVRLEDLDKRLADVTSKRQIKEQELGAAEENVKDLTTKIENNRADLKANRDKTVDLVGQETRARNSLIKFNADIQNMQSRERRLKMEQANVLSDKERIGQEFKSLTDRMDSVGRELDSKKREFDVFADEYSERQNKHYALLSDKTQKEKRINEIRPRREFLEKLVSEREGMPESVKEVMRAKEAGDGSVAGVHGVLSELVSVSEGYGESLESVMGEASQSLVVDSREAAERVTAYLSGKALPSANFVILDELKKMLESRSEGHITKGTLDDVTQVLSAKEPYSSAIKALLSDIYVTVSPDAARVLVEDESFKGRVIGEKGEVYGRGRHRSRNFSEREVISLFGRQEKVRQLREDEEKITAEVLLLAGEIAEVELWLKDAARQRERLENELREKQIEFSNVASKKSVTGEKLESISEELVLLDAEIEEETSAIRQAWGEIEKFNLELKMIEAESVKVQEAIEEAQKAIQEMTIYREESIYVISDVKADLYALRKEEENLSDNLGREKESFVRIENEVNERRSRISESGERIKALDSEMKGLAEKNKENSAELSSKETQMGTRKSRKEHLLQQIQQEEHKIKEREARLEEARNRARDIDVNGKELEYKRSSMIDRVREAYKVNLAELQLTLEENIDWAEIERKIAELKDQIESMGEVSLGAVEEHKQLEERYQFLVKQRDDLVKSKDDLMEAIQKINRTTRTMFLESFEAVRKEFNIYFKMLFNGGKADLILQDETNVLECGIDIEVRPPGKKLHNIMQLSGGEKAMTAIALIFALFKVNPSPFCILDEIDAPLDESNVVRFCRVLQEFLKLSQFIVVTHNRMTIQLADVLYGITMQEKGVSQIVSVKFAEEKGKTESRAETPASVETAQVDPETAEVAEPVPVEPGSEPEPSEEETEPAKAA